MTFNFNQNFIMNTPKIKKEAVCPTKKMPVRSNEKKYIMDILKLIRS